MAIDVYAQAERYLTSLGVDVERGLGRAAREREYETHRVRAAADGIRGLAVQLKRAERDLLAESRGYLQHATGFTSARLGEARERVTQLEAALGEACMHDGQMARQVRRSVV